MTTDKNNAAPDPQPAELAEQQGVGDLPRPLEDLRDATQHVIDCADGGDDYACGRPMIEAMTTLGIMEKTGRGLWSTNVQVARAVVDALAATGKQQVGEVQGDGLHLSGEDRAVLQRIQDALPTVGLNGWTKGVEVLERLLRDSLAARQPGWNAEQLDRALGETIDQRDRYHEVADDLAAHIERITGVEIGEHSSVNCPWQNAIDAAESYTPAQGIYSGNDQAATHEPNTANNRLTQGIDPEKLRAVLQSVAMFYDRGLKGRCRGRIDEALALIDQRDAAPGVGNG